MACVVSLAVAASLTLAAPAAAWAQTSLEAPTLPEPPAEPTSDGPTSDAESPTDLGNAEVDPFDPSDVGLDEGLAPDEGLGGLADFDVTEGLFDLGPEEIEGHELGAVHPPANIGDLLDDGGLFEWEDATGEMKLARLGSQGAATFGSGAGVDASTLADLATSAAISYVPPHDERSNDTSAIARERAQRSPDTQRSAYKPANADNWFVSDTGQLFLPVGGVMVLFAPGVDDTVAREVLASQGVAPERVSPTEGLPGAYSIATSSDVESLELVRLLSDMPEVESVTPNMFTPKTNSDSESLPVNYPTMNLYATTICRSDNPPMSDALSICLWHLDKSKSYSVFSSGKAHKPLVDINMGDVWETTKGEGVTVSVVDATWEASHEDLVGNSDRAASTYWGRRTGENGSYAPWHGTAVAGIIGARDNAIGGRGIAPRVTLQNVNFVDAQNFWTNQQVYLHRAKTVAVANHSYSAHATGRLKRESPVIFRALEQSLKSGYDGKGTVHVKGAGNGKNDGVGDETALYESLSHRGHIVACAVDSGGTDADYSEEGSNLWVCGPSGARTRHGLLGPIGKNQYHAGLRGTSYSAPVVSGVAALVRSANNALTWRDVKLILANTAQKNDSSDSSWQTGATKYGSTKDSYSYSRKYGFGLVDASAAVTAAKTWKNLPPMFSTWAFKKPVQDVKSATGTEFTLDIKSDVSFVEHVDVTINMDTSHFRALKLVLVSPSGRESLLVDSSSALGSNCRCPLYGDFTFGSARHLGEAAAGTWKLKVYNTTGVPAKLNAWGVKVHGHNPANTDVIELSVPASVTEGEDIPVTVTLRGAALSSDLVVPVVVTPTRATPPGQPNAAYTALTSITIPAGELKASATISTNDDTDTELPKIIMVGIGPLPASYVPVTDQRVIIYDNDQPWISVAAAKYSINEGEPVEFEVTMHQNPAARTAVWIHVMELRPTNAAPAYLPYQYHSRLYFTSAGTQKLTYPTTKDQNDEPPRQIQAFADEPGHRGYKIKGSKHTYVWVSDDLSLVSIAADGDVNEGADASFTLKAVPAPTSPLAVQVAVDETGFFGVDTSTRTVTIGTNGTGTLTVPTVHHKFTQPAGAVTATVQKPSDDSYFTANVSNTATAKVTDIDTDPLTADAPVVIVSAGKAITEGGDAVFTLRALPGPSNDLDVEVTVASGDRFGVTDGSQTVTIPAGGTTDLTITTTDDKVAGSDGKITVTVVDDASYELYSKPSASVAVTDAGVPVTPVVSIASDGDITEGYAASFTVSANPAPRAPLSVTLNLSASGDFGLSSGSWTITVPTTGSIRTALSTLDDSVDEPNGSLTASVADGAGYDVSSTAGSAIVNIADNDDPQPIVSIAAGSGVAEGGSASFTVSVSPAPSAALSVTVDVSASGSFGVTTGSRTVTVPTTGTAILSVSTTGDTTDEPDGSVTVSVTDGAGYDVSSTAGSATVAVSDDDDPPVVSIAAGSGVTEGGSASFTVSVSPAPSAALTVTVDVSASGSFGVTTGSRTVTVPTSGSATLSVATSGDSVDEPDGSVTVAVTDGASYDVSSTAGSATVAISDDDDTPVVRITKTWNTTEGGNAVFTLSVSPVPPVAFNVSVDVTAEGSFGVTTGTRTVRIRRAAVLLVSTTDDSVDEADGSVTATVADGASYDVSSTAGSATVRVLDDDFPPPATPVVSITAGSDVTEGSNASFTLTANPTPSSALSVSVNVTSSGSFGVTTGSRTVTVPTTGSATLSVATSGDSTDEADGSVSVSVTDGASYDVSSTAGSATVNVADDDDAQQSVVPVVYVVPASLVSDVRGYAAETSNGVPHVNRWKQVLLAFGEDVPGFSGTPMTVADAQQHAQTFWSVRWDPVVEALQRLAANTQQQPVTPVVSITAGSGVTEGSSALFTVSASPAPSAALSVSVSVTASGSFGVTTGSRTVTIPTSGTATLAVATTGDSTDEVDGSVSVSVADGAGYDVSSTANSATVNVADDDVPPVVVYVVPASLVADVRGYAAETFNGVPHVNRWKRVLVAFGESVPGFSGSAMTVVEAQGHAQAFWSVRWDPVVTALQSLAANPPPQQQPTPQPQPQPPPVVTPVVNVTAGGGVTEGSSASFTLSASPTPSSSLVVTVNVTASGSFGVTTGSRTVTVPTSGSATLSVSTSGDSTDEPDGSVTVSVTDAAAYDVSSTAGTATVAISDDDDPPPPPVVTPVVSVTAGGGVTEGSNASFTLSASPTPSSSLVVTVNVSASGSFGVTTGSRTVTVPTSGTATLSVSTTGDSTDEPNGSVTVSVADGASYDVSSTAGTATVAVADDDDPPPPPPPATPVVVGDVKVSVDGQSQPVGPGGTLEFVVTLSKAADSDVKVGFKVSAVGGAWLMVGWDYVVRGLANKSDSVGELTFARGETRQVVYVDVPKDAWVLTSATILVALTSTSSGVEIDSDNNSAIGRLRS